MPQKMAQLPSRSKESIGGMSALPPKALLLGPDEIEAKTEELSGREEQSRI
jgi:hypothetical protein